MGNSYLLPSKMPFGFVLLTDRWVFSEPVFPSMTFLLIPSNPGPSKSRSDYFFQNIYINNNKIEVKMIKFTVYNYSDLCWLLLSTLEEK